MLLFFIVFWSNKCSLHEKTTLKTITPNLWTRAYFYGQYLMQNWGVIKFPKMQEMENKTHKADFHCQRQAIKQTTVFFMTESILKLPSCTTGQFRVNKENPATAHLIWIIKSLFVKYCDRGSRDRTCLRRADYWSQ